MITPLIFLDVDGVLNTHHFDEAAQSNRIGRVFVARLNRTLDATGASVVLTSAWRYLVHRGDMTLEGLGWLLRSHGFLAGRLIGVTDPDTMVSHLLINGVPTPVPDERGDQIARWRAEHNHAGPYVVIDDLDLGISAAGHPFVRTDPAVGFSFLNSLDVRRMLGSKHEESSPCSESSR